MRVSTVCESSDIGDSVLGGAVVRAVGVSGGTADQDRDCARAGALAATRAE